MFVRVVTVLGVMTLIPPECRWERISVFKVEAQHLVTFHSLSQGLRLYGYT